MGHEHQSRLEVSGRLLVVEDEPGVRKLLTRLLKTTGNDFEVAESGRQGLELFSDHDDFALVILDLSLPDLNGLELLSSIRETEPRLPVVISSGYESSSFKEILEQDPHLHYLRKPYLIERFWEVLGNALGTRGNGSG